LQKLLNFKICPTGESRSAEIEVRVQFSPSITSLQKSVVKSGRGLVVEFVCAIVGEPTPKVLWYKGEEVRAKLQRKFKFTNCTDI